MFGGAGVVVRIEASCGKEEDSDSGCQAEERSYGQPGRKP